MAFEITKSFVVKAPPAEVWAFLVDARRVASCMPGAAITEQLDDRTWAGTMTVKVGPVQASYRGKIVFEQLDASAGRAAIVATGQDVRGKGGADLRLTSSVAGKGEGETEVTAVSKVNVSGILAQMGRGMVEDVGDQIFQIFSQRMRTELEAAAAPSPPPGEGEKPESPRTPSPGAAGSRAAAPATPAAPIPSPTVEPFDAGALGAKVARRAAGRALSAPTPLWLSLLIGLAVLYLLLR